MPATPFHFGPSGFIGLLFRKWIDVPVFIAANILIDVEVLADSGFSRFKWLYPYFKFDGFAHGYPVHQFWHFHTLLVGGLAGAVFGLLVYFIKPFRRLSEKCMSFIGLPGGATLLSMVLAGVLGAWLHVLIDSFYHYDVQIFWPYRDNSIFRWINNGKISNMEHTQQQVVFWCIIFWILMAVLYALLLTKKLKNNNNSPTKNIDKIANDKP